MWEIFKDIVMKGTFEHDLGVLEKSAQALLKNE